jgi:hypothetical protein
MSGNSGNNARDNRQRGNAAQLLEKYKNLARDAQLAGDRVQTEYYLQFADHYFRVLEDNRSRYEDQQPQRRSREEEDDEVEGDEELMADGDGDDEAEAEPRQQQQRPRREARGPRESREPRERYRERPDRPERPRANGAGRSEDHESRDERIALGVLPPAIGTDLAESAEDEAPRPRRRAARKPREDDGGTAEA